MLNAADSSLAMEKGQIPIKGELHTKVRLQKNNEVWVAQINAKINAQVHY